ncbi:hypothetical protein Taro_052189, partial [Colocasia esculenta]|nr:hypothetical protein [Colocasia esculenta]
SGSKAHVNGVSNLQASPSPGKLPGNTLHGQGLSTSSWLKSLRLLQTDSCSTRSFLFFSTFSPSLPTIDPQSERKAKRLAMGPSIFCAAPKLAHLLLWTLLVAIPTATTAEPLTQICDATGGSGTNYTANSTFESNLKTLLSSLPASGYTSGYSNGTAGSVPDRVYGLVLCRGDVSASDCRSCLDTAAQEVLQVCPSKRSTVVWYDYCMLRYSDRRFFSVPDDVLKSPMWNTQNLTEVTQFNEQLNLLMARLVLYAAHNRSARMFATGVADYVDPETPKIYGLVQCTMDQSAGDCDTCLTGLISEMPSWAFGKKGARYLKATCNIRYELYSFYKGSAMVSVPLSANATPPTAVLQPPLAPLSPPIDTPDAQDKKKSNSTRTVLAIAIPLGAAFALISIICICFCRRKSKQRKLYMRDAQEITTIESLLFDLSTLRAATGNFSELNLLGQGGFGSVYKGLLPSGQEIAVKRLLAGSGQGVEELKNEVVLLAKLQHRNLVRILGVCLEGEEKLLVYEYVHNRSLDKFLFDPALSHQLNWERRYKIIGGVARGLQYLHDDSQVKIIHRDLKASNILLDAEMNSKISDFGLARLFPGDQTQASTTRVWEHWTGGTVLEIVDSSLSGQYQRSEVLRCTQIGLLCVQEAPAERPTMTSVVLMLSSYSVSLQLPQRPAFFAGYSQSNLSVLKEGLDSSTEARSILYSTNEVSITELDPR